MATYPSNIYSHTTVVDGSDYPLATHINTPAAEIVAIETELGTNPRGTATDVKTRLSKSMSDAGMLDFATSTELTIASGSITPTQNWHTVDTESDAASDDLDTIVSSGVSDGFILVIRANNSARTVVVKHNTGNIYTTSAGNVTLDEDYKTAEFIYDATLSKWVQKGGGGSSSIKGVVQFLHTTVPTTTGAGVTALTGASSPAESFGYFEFVDASTTYRDFLCHLTNYNGGGLTFTFPLMRTSSSAGDVYYMGAAIRRINTGTEDLGSAHTYDYNDTSVTVPAGPPAATIPMLGTITFTDGSDMDSLASNEYFYLRLRRQGGHGSDTAADVARVMAITGRET